MFFAHFAASLGDLCGYELLTRDSRLAPPPTSAGIRSPASGQDRSRASVRPAGSLAHSSTLQLHDTSVPTDRRPNPSTHRLASLRAVVSGHKHSAGPRGPSAPQ